MPFCRIPGPYGEGSRYGCISHSQPIGMHPLLFGDEEFPHNTPGPTGTNSDLGALVAESKPEVPEDDKKEFRLLQDVYGIVDIKGGSYKVKDKKGKWHDNIETYIKDRNAFFGSADEFRLYKKKAFEELEADNRKLRSIIEPNKKVRKKKTEWAEAQVIFYCWVRKAYEKVLKDDTVDIPKLIKSSTSKKLSDALKQVRVDYGHEFQAGGFNPRPMKISGRYRLGTLSEHALGKAIDIESKKNAHIKSTTWGQILKFTGKSLDHATRKSKWKTAPEELHKAIKEINDEFVKKLREAIKEAESAGGKTGLAPAHPASAQAKASAKIDPLDMAMAKNQELKNMGKDFLQKWKDGFFAMDWALVKELHEEGFTWGGTFGDPDLHHFEI